MSDCLKRLLKWAVRICGIRLGHVAPILPQSPEADELKQLADRLNDITRGTLKEPHRDSSLMDPPAKVLTPTSEQDFESISDFAKDRQTISEPVPVPPKTPPPAAEDYESICQLHGYAKAWLDFSYAAKSTDKEWVTAWNLALRAGPGAVRRFGGKSEYDLHTTKEP